MNKTSSQAIDRLLSDLDGITKTASLSVSGSNVLPKVAAPISEPTGQTTSSGPTVSADDGLQTHTSGSEETKQKADASAQSPIGPDATGKITTPAQEAVQADLGVTQAGVGKDPAVEKDMTTKQKDPGEGTSTAALSFAGEVTSKDASADDIVKAGNHMTSLLTNLMKSALATESPAPAAPAAPAAPKAAAAAPAAPAVPATPAAIPVTEEQKTADELGGKVAALAMHFVRRGVKKADLVVGYLNELEEQKRASATGKPAKSTGFSFLKRAAESGDSGGSPAGGEESTESPAEKKKEPAAPPEEGGGGGSAPPPPGAGGDPTGAGGAGTLDEIQQVLQEMGMTPEDLLQLLKSVGSQPPGAAGAGGGMPPGAGGAAGGPPPGAGGPPPGAGGPPPSPEEQMMVAASYYGNIGYLMSAAEQLNHLSKTAGAKQYRPAKTAEEQTRRNEIRSFISELNKRARR